MPNGVSGSSKVFFDDGQVYGWKFSSDGATGWQVITNSNNSPDTSLFEVPAGFCEMGIPDCGS
jgi:hypothetical protein